MDPGQSGWAMQYTRQERDRKRKLLQNSSFFKTVFAITFALAFIFMFVSIFALFSPAHSADFTEPSAVYFFVLLFNTPFFPVSTFWLNVGMVALYSVFFLAMLSLGISRWKGPFLENPIVYYGGLVSFGLIMSVLITVIELAAGIQIGGTSIETGIQQHPYLSYVQLIYAPFAEELGFRIIPLGLLTVYFVARKRGTGLDKISSFLLPGLIRKKYGIKLTYADYVLIVATSIIFGLAHFLSGAWDPGKIISAALVGLILAFGFIKFGIFVDVPMHWFFNGFSTVSLIYPPMESVSVTGVLWAIISGAISIVFLLIVFIERNAAVREKRSIIPPDPFT